MPVILPDTPPPPGGLAIGKGSTLYLKISPFASTSRHDVSPMRRAVGSAEGGGGAESQAATVSG